MLPAAQGALEAPVEQAVRVVQVALEAPVVRGAPGEQPAGPAGPGVPAALAAPEAEARTRRFEPGQ